MDDKRPAQGWDGQGAHQHNTPPAPPRAEPAAPYKTQRPKRRRKGPQNDAGWPDKLSGSER
jgi:hypothetical protein